MEQYNLSKHESSPKMQYLIDVFNKQSEKNVMITYSKYESNPKMWGEKAWKLHMINQTLSNNNEENNEANKKIENIIL